MKTIACKDLGMTDCNFSASGETLEEVTKKLIDHAENVHPEKMAAMTEKDTANMMSKMNELWARA